MSGELLGVEFWGTRGSFPVPGKDKTRYGTNTSCVSICAGGNYFVFDAGTGLYDFGKQCVEKSQVFEASIFFSHFHMDHVEGLPFFKLSFANNAKVDLYAKNLYGVGVTGNALRDLFKRPYFPVEFLAGESQTEFSFTSIEDSKVYKFPNNVTLEAILVKHTEDICLSYKLQYNNKKVVYMTDIELSKGLKEEEHIIEFVRDADMLILDAYFTEENFIEGWGHSTWERNIELANMASVKQLVMFHHNIESSDWDLDILYERFKYSTKKLTVARDGLKVMI